MPTTQQMIQRAEDLERRAQALRLAAAEMTDQMAANKAPLFPGALDHAIALRKQQRATTNGHQNGAGPAPAAAGGASGGGVDREALVRAAMADGPQTSRQLVAVLAQHGEEVSGQWVTQGVLRLMPDVRKIGKGSQVRWALKQKRTPRQPKPEITVTPRRMGRGPGKKQHYTVKVKDQRQATAAFLDAVGTEGRTKQQLLEAGVKPHLLSALGVMVRYGYLKHKGNEYARTAKVYTA